MASIDLVDVVSASYAMKLLQWCHQRGYLVALRAPHAVVELVEEHEEQKVLAAALEYLRLGTDIIKMDSAGRYVLSRDYHNYVFLELLLDKFGAGYGPMFEHLREVARNGNGASFVDHDSIAQAFEVARPRSSPHVFEVLEKAAARNVLDVGCGAGAFLVEFCEKSSRHRALGVDEREAMCARARRLVADEGLRERVRVRKGDAHRLSGVLSRGDRDEVDAIHTRFMVNSMFEQEGAASRFLCGLRRLFPGRTLVVVDYYGQLLRVKKRPPKGYSQTLLQDLVQVLSGQGVPPATTDSWNEIYEEAGCKLQANYELSAPGLSWFVHSVML